MDRIRYAAMWFVGALLLAWLPPWTAAMAATWQDVRPVIATRAIASDGSHYVAAAGNGIWTSTNLKSWQRVSLPAAAGEIYSDVIWDGSHFVAVGDGVISSADGSTWTVVSKPDAAAHIWISITVSGGIYVVVGGDGTKVLRSTDGTTWNLVNTGVFVDPSSTITLQGIGSNGSLFVATGFETTFAPGTPTQGDVVLTSVNGAVWTQRVLPNHGFAEYNTGITNNVAWSPTIPAFIIGGGDGFYTSPDGVTWMANDLSTVLPASSNAWVFDSIQFLNGQFVAAGFDSISVAPGGDQIAVFTSSDGINWTNHDLAPRVSSVYGMSEVIFSAGQYVAAGSQAVYSSSNASTWKLQYSLTQTNLPLCIIQGGGKYVIPGEGGNLSSSDGSTWPDTLTGSTPSDASVGVGCGAYGAGSYVTLFNQRLLASSTDAATWTPFFPALTGMEYQAVAWNGSEFLAVGTDTASSVGTATSPDGKTWTEASLSGLPVSNVKFGPNGGLLYANGNFVAWGTASGTPFIAISADGNVWKVPTISSLPADASIMSVAFGSGTYLALVNESDGTSHVFSSTDGLKWEAVTNNIPNEIWTTLIWGNNEFLAAGSDPITGQGVAAEGDAAGSSWQRTPLQDSAEVFDVLWDGSKYVAVSDYDILTLSPSVSSGGGGGGGGGSGGGNSSGGGGGAFDMLALSLLSGLAIRRRSRWTSL